jgi:hypothetical protein
VPSSDPFDIPDWAPVPPPYTDGARAICTYQGQHRGRRFEKIFKKVGDDRVLVHDGITFLPYTDRELYMPEARASARSGCLVVLGALVTLAFLAFSLLPSSLVDGLANLPVGVWIGIGVAVLAIGYVGLSRGDKERKANAMHGIWVEGVLLFPDALVIRSQIRVDVFPKKDILRFELRLTARRDQAEHDTCLVRRGDDGDEEAIRVTSYNDSTKLLEEWRQRE